MSKQMQIAIRLVVDALCLLVAALIGSLISFSTGGTELSLTEYYRSQALEIALLPAVCLPLFYFSGFYTKGRAYSTRYKPIFVLQIAAVGFLIWTAIVYFLQRGPWEARTFLISTAIIGLVLLVSCRVGSRILRLIQDKDYGMITPNVSTAASTQKPKNVVVIGGAGYIGSGLLTKLLNSGYNVRLVDSFMFGDDPISEVKGHPNLQIVKSDFRQIDVIVQNMRGMDAVVHLGAIVGDPACALDEDFTIDVNVLATRMIAECAKGFGIKKFVFASTCSVYGASEEVLNERSHLNPVSLYARSKIACERILEEMTTDSFRPTILRFGTVYGLSGRTRFDLVVNLLTAKAIVDKVITVYGQDQWRPFVHVDDASLAVAMALDAPVDVVGSQIYNVGGEAGNMTLGQVGELIKKIIPTADLQMLGNDGDRRDYRVDFSKIRNHIGFEPKWTVEQGILQVKNAFDTNKVSDYNAAQYSNVKYLSEEAAKSGLRNDIARIKSMVDEPLPETG